MHASQYKDYVLVLLFIKYVSDKYAGQPYAPITIPEGASSKDMVALKGARSGASRRSSASTCPGRIEHTRRYSAYTDPARRRSYSLPMDESESCAPRSLTATHQAFIRSC